MAQKIKSLYNLTLRMLFYKQYYCIYCDILEFEKEYIWNHVTYYHSDDGVGMVKRFICKKCNELVIDLNTIKHIITCNQKQQT